MTPTTGSKPPLHRRFNEAKSLEYIRNRYLGMKGKFDAQLAVLQSDDAFLTRCEQLYRKGYKDWHILSAIYNRLLMLESTRRGIDLNTEAGREAHVGLSKESFTATYPAEAFDGVEWDFAFKMHAITCLGTYGFEQRSRAVSPDAIVAFLRGRMRHFDLDIPHDPMFARPCAPWPDVSSS
jgi:hypothetical protein